MSDINAIVEKYIELRDLKAEKKKAYDDSVKEIEAALERAELFLLKKMNEEGLQSVSTGRGTAYKSTRTSATVADWDSTLGFIRDNELWQMLERRVSKTAVEEFRNINNDLPPGINWREEVTVNVRRS